MANWSNPVLTSTYTDVLNILKDRDVDLALQFDGTTSSNVPAGAIRWSSSANRWQKWSGSAWGELATTYALTGLSTTGNASIGGTLGVTGVTTLTGGGTSTTPATADNSTAIATTAFVKAQNYAPLASPTLTGTPAAPTASVGTNTTQIATTAYVNAEISNDAVLKSGSTMTGALTLSGDPAADLHAVPRQWVENRTAKQSCRVATTANITLSGTQTIDGIALSIGDRVLVRQQTTSSQNGIYLVASGAWTRSTDAATWDALVSALVAVEQGTANDDTFWMSETARGGTLGTTAITFQLVSNAMLGELGAVSTSGLLARTGTNAAAARSIAVSGTGLSVTNADGVSGNPTVTSNATNANTASTIVARDASGNFSAGTITGALSGNATTATTLATGRTISLTGDITGTSAAFNGSANASIAATITAGAVGTTELADAGVTAAKLNGAQTGTAPIYGARAWVNFNGTGTIASRADGNVTSITDNGVGDYTINFTTALPDANYSKVISVSSNGSSNATILAMTDCTGTGARSNPATGSFRFQVQQAGVGVVDAQYIHVVVLD